MERIYSGMPRFNWRADQILSSHWNSQPMVENHPAYGDRGPYRITTDALKATPDMAVLLTEVEFVKGRPLLDEGEEILTMAGLYTGGVLCRVLYSECQEHGATPCYLTVWNASKTSRTTHQTIEAAMTDFCKELMLVNPYDHILETIGARGFNHTTYQSNEEFGSWA